MDLLVSQLKTAIRRLLDTKGVRARVVDKLNRHGEVVIGVILAPREEVSREPAAPDSPAEAAAPPPRESDPS